jgi:hypothetical protein
MIALLLSFALYGTPADSVLVCTGPAAYAYHSEPCEGLAQCDYEVIAVTADSAAALMRTPCLVCYKKQ